MMTHDDPLGLTLLKVAQHTINSAYNKYDVQYNIAKHRKGCLLSI
jgi:hypothetical protein